VPAKVVTKSEKTVMGEALCFREANAPPGFGAEGMGRPFRTKNCVPSGKIV
jgi:hypothetical protein